MEAQAAHLLGLNGRGSIFPPGHPYQCLCPTGKRNEPCNPTNLSDLLVNRYKLCYVYTCIKDAIFAKSSFITHIITRIKRTWFIVIILWLATMSAIVILHNTQRVARLHLALITSW